MGDDDGGGGGGGGGGPAPFLLKTYEMVDDPSTDEIVSWSSTEKSFVVWNPPDFAAQLLPTYFKHNNFSSFIRQLNTYGFRKIEPERWEFANDDFAKGQKHLLKNIYRRKPMHSHSHPPAGGLPEAERRALEEEIERLKREKTSIQASLLKFKQQQSGTKIQLDDLERRLADMEQRQLKMVAFMHRAMQNPRFMENLVKMANPSSVDFSLLQKKRRLPPGVDYCKEAVENSLYDDHSSIYRHAEGHMLDQEFCDKLKLELCSAMPDSNMVADSTQSSDEEAENSKGKQTTDVMIERFLPVRETLELCDTGTSCPTKNLLFPADVEGDALFPCQLSLTLASSAMQIDRSEHLSRTTNALDLAADKVNEPSINNAIVQNHLSIAVGKESIASAFVDAKATSAKEAPPNNDETPIPPGRVNDVFWEQFLTERPGAIEAEEASSMLSTKTCDEQNHERENSNIWRSKQNVEQLKL